MKKLMNRIDQKFKELKSRRQKAISVFLTAGYPSLSVTEKLVLELEKSGADFFEIGFPFSDPIADGPVIQKSSETALKNGVTWKKFLAAVKRIRMKSEVPLVFMSYANTLFCRGWEKSLKELSSAGFDGAIIPDMIPEETGTLSSYFNKNGMKLIYLVSPTSSDDRIEKVCRNSGGFVYCVSVTGVTGARKRLPETEIKHFLKRVRTKSRLPAILGFGISHPEQCKLFKNDADGFVIGSALVKLIEQEKSSGQLMDKAKKFIKPFSEAVK